MQVQLTAEEAREHTPLHVTPMLDELAREGARRMLALALELAERAYHVPQEGRRSG